MILVGGIGNVFLGDDGFGCEVARKLALRPQRPSVRVVDFGIRGIDLAYALPACDAAVLIDTVARGGIPGTLYVIEPERGSGAEPDPHGMTPDRVLRWSAVADGPKRLRLVGCEPATFEADDLGAAGLSPRVRVAVDEAVHLVESLIAELEDA